MGARPATGLIRLLLCQTRPSDCSQISVREREGEFAGGTDEAHPSLPLSGTSLLSAAVTPASGASGGQTARVPTDFGGFTCSLVSKVAWLTSKPCLQS